MNDDANLIRVGDLAATAGLTVRALHHYEEIGLLAPVERTPAGHRLYGSVAFDHLESEIDEQHRLRAGLIAALVDIADDRDPTHDLVHILEDMMNNTLLKSRVSILVYRDITAAHRFLVWRRRLQPGRPRPLWRSWLTTSMSIIASLPRSRPMLCTSPLINRMVTGNTACVNQKVRCGHS